MMPAERPEQGTDQAPCECCVFCRNSRGGRFFFFQAEDGIRDDLVTGVQTCALPISIAAVVIGGGSLSGGEGTVVGTLVGAFIMGLLSNGSDLLGVSPYLQQAIIGGVIILAVKIGRAACRERV